MIGKEIADAIAPIVQWMVIGGAAVWTFRWIYGSIQKSGRDKHRADESEGREDHHAEAREHLAKPTTGDAARLLERWRSRRKRLPNDRAG